jgi:hypothetical protein
LAPLDETRAAVAAGEIHFELQGVEQVVGQAELPRGFQKALGAELAHGAVRVVAVGQEREAHRAIAFHQRQGVLQGAPCGALAGRVPIEAEHHLRHLAKQQFEMLTGDRRAERGDHVGQAELMERDHVHVAFHHQQAVELALGGQRLVQAVELAALVEDLGLRRVEVLRLAVLDDPGRRSRSRGRDGRGWGTSRVHGSDRSSRRARA